MYGRRLRIGRMYGCAILSSSADCAHSGSGRTLRGVWTNSLPCIVGLDSYLFLARFLVQIRPTTDEQVFELKTRGLCQRKPSGCIGVGGPFPSFPKSISPFVLKSAQGNTSVLLRKHFLRGSQGNCWDMFIIGQLMAPVLVENSICVYHNYFLQITGC
jgi:hypothetical protein